jgi:O-antigen ligase
MWLYYIMLSVFALQNQRIWNMRVVGYLTVIKILGLVVVAWALVYGLGRGRLNALGNRVVVLFLLIFLVATRSHLSYFLNNDETSSAAFNTYLSMLGLMIATMLLVDSRSKVRWALLACWVGVALGGMYVIREFQLYHGLYESFRPGWVVGDPNYYAAGVAVCLPMGLVLLELEKRPLLRLLVLGCFGVTGIAFLLTASRGGLVAVGAFGLFAILRVRKWRKRIVAFGIVLFFLLLLYPRSPLYRMLSPGRADRGSTEYHKELVASGLEMILSHPIGGVGLGSFKSESAEGLKGGIRLIAHNMYIEVAAELGLPALALFLLLIYGSWRNLGQVMLHPDLDSELEQLSLGLQGCLVAFVVAALFISSEYQRYFWLVVFLSAVLKRLVPVAQVSERPDVSAALPVSV